MTKKKLLFISNYFPPISGPGSYRPYFFVKNLHTKFESITVLCSGADSIYGNDDSFSLDFPNVKIVRVGHNNNSKLNKILFKFKLHPLFNLLFPKYFFERHRVWYNKALRWSYSMKASDYDSIYVTSGPFSACLLAEKIHDRLKIPFIIDLRDPFSISPSRIWMSYWHWKYFNKLEKKILTKSSKIVVVAPSMKEHYLNVFPSIEESKISVILNGFDGDINTSLQPSSAKGKLKIVYAGSLIDYNGEEVDQYKKTSFPYKIENYNTKTRSLFYLIEAINLLDKEEKEKLEIHIFGVKDLPISISKIKEYNLTNLFKLHPKVPYSKVKQEMSNSDLLLLPMEERLDGRSYFMTGKLYEYIQTNKAILALGTKNDCTDLLDQLRYNYFHSNNNAKQISALLRTLILKLEEIHKIPGLKQNNNPQIEIVKRKYQAEQLYSLLNNL